MGTSKRRNIVKQKGQQESHKQKPVHQDNHHSNKLNTFIGGLHQAPQFLQDELNYIRHGYRINFHKKRQVIKSLFMWHNEFINIWTHLLGAILVCGLIFYIYFNYNELFRPIALEQLNGILQCRTLFCSQEYLSNEIVGLEKHINERLEAGIHNLQDEVHLIQDQFHQKVNEFTAFMEQMASKDLSELQKLMMNAFNWKTLEWKHSLVDAFEKFRHQAFDAIESKEYDWIDLYIELSNKSDEDIWRARQNVVIARWPIFAFLVSAILCLLGSTIFHLFYCMSVKVNKVLLRLDYAGIVFLISGSTIPPLFYGFYCQQHYAIFYAGIQCIFGLVVFVVTLFDFIHTQEYRGMKARMYAGLGIISAVPIFHLLYGDASTLQGYDFVTQFPYYGAMGVSYLYDELIFQQFRGGLMIFQVRWPERQHPGQFDNCGHSHQLWHGCVIIGILFTYVATLNSYYTRIDRPCIA